MQKETLTRKQLYQLVWSHSLSALARKYNISDNGLRTALKTPLPEIDEEPTIQLVVRDSSIPDQPKTKPSTLQQKIEEIENTPGLICKVPKKLSIRIQLLSLS